MTSFKSFDFSDCDHEFSYNIHTITRACFLELAAKTNDSVMALLEIGPIVFGGTSGIIQYLRPHHLLALQQNCSRCITAMQERSRRDVSD